MIYEVDFTVQEDGQFETVQTALIHALNVTECRTIAEEMAAEIVPYEENLHVDIGEIAE